MLHFSVSIKSLMRLVRYEVTGLLGDLQAVLKRIIKGLVRGGRI